MPDEFARAEMDRVLAQYPGLRIKGPGILEGEFELHHTFDGVTLQDRFTIRVAASNPNSDRVPALFEIGGRTKAIALKYNLPDVRALHQNVPDGTACVCVKQEELSKFPPGSSLLAFFDNLVAPYLYGLSYYDNFGKWPWGEYSHGVLGMLEFYAGVPDQSKEHYAEAIRTLQNYKDVWPRVRKQLRRPSAKRECMCGSGESFGKCHPQAWRGLCRMLTGIRRLGSTPDSLRRS